MNTPCKFRVWDGEKMHEPPHEWVLGMHTDSAEPGPGGYQVYERGDMQLYRKKGVSDMGLMISAYKGTPLFYTGLTDAEGTEIYEGDVVGHERMESFLVVQWWDRGGCFRAFDPEAPDGTASYPLGNCLAEVGGPPMTKMGTRYESPDEG